MSIPILYKTKHLITVFALEFLIHIEMVLYPSEIKFYLCKNC